MAGEIPLGMQMAIKSIIKLLGLDPARVESSIAEIGQTVKLAAADLATIRRQNAAIMAHLGIADIVEPEKGYVNGHSIEHGTGTVGGGGNEKAAGNS